MPNVSPKCAAVTRYWSEYYVNNEACGGCGLCSLCGNTGIIDTTNSAKSPRGDESPGRKNYCICPNGQVMRKHGAKLE